MKDMTNVANTTTLSEEEKADLDAAGAKLSASPPPPTPYLTFACVQEIKTPVKPTHFFLEPYTVLRLFCI